MNWLNLHSKKGWRQLCETWVLFYTYPSNNVDYIGYVKSELMVDVLLRGKEKGESMTGYTDGSCKIK